MAGRGSSAVGRPPPAPRLQAFGPWRNHPRWQHVHILRVPENREWLPRGCTGPHPPPGRGPLRFPATLPPPAAWASRPPWELEGDFPPF